MTYYALFYKLLQITQNDLVSKRIDDMEAALSLLITEFRTAFVSTNQLIIIA